MNSINIVCPGVQVQFIMLMKCGQVHCWHIPILGQWSSTQYTVLCFPCFNKLLQNPLIHEKSIVIMTIALSLNCVFPMYVVVMAYCHQRVAVSYEEAICNHYKQKKKKICLEGTVERGCYAVFIEEAATANSKIYVEFIQGK